MQEIITNPQIHSPKNFLATHKRTKCYFYNKINIYNSDLTCPFQKYIFFVHTCKIMRISNMSVSVAISLVENNNDVYTFIKDLMENVKIYVGLNCIDHHIQKKSNTIILQLNTKRLKVYNEQNEIIPNNDLTVGQLISLFIKIQNITYSNKIGITNLDALQIKYLKNPEHDCLFLIPQHQNALCSTQLISPILSPITQKVNTHISPLTLASLNQKDTSSIQPQHNIQRVPEPPLKKYQPSQPVKFALSVNDLTNAINSLKKIKDKHKLNEKHDNNCLIIKKKRYITKSLSLTTNIFTNYDNLCDIMSKNISDIMKDNNKINTIYNRSSKILLDSFTLTT